MSDYWIQYFKIDVDALSLGENLKKVVEDGRIEMEAMAFEADSDEDALKFLKDFSKRTKDTNELIQYCPIRLLKELPF